MKIFKYFIGAIFLYILIGYIMLFFPKNGEGSFGGDRRVYLYYDLLHTNIIIDITEDNKSRWERLFPELLLNRDFKYLEFGLGDMETYLTTKEWKDLKFTTALRALFLNTDSVIHISYFNNLDLSRVKELRLTNTQYSALLKSLIDSFGDSPKFISYGYFSYDGFYRAIYTYNLLFTCNTWVGELLKDANVTVAWWTPFSYPLVESIR